MAFISSKDLLNVRLCDRTTQCNAEMPQHFFIEHADYVFALGVLRGLTSSSGGPYRSP
jgi:hypothetical protein